MAVVRPFCVYTGMRGFFVCGKIVGDCIVEILCHQTFYEQMLGRCWLANIAQQTLFVGIGEDSSISVFRRRRRRSRRRCCCR